MSPQAFLQTHGEGDWVKTNQLGRVGRLVLTKPVLRLGSPHLQDQCLHIDLLRMDVCLCVFPLRGGPRRGGSDFWCHLIICKTITSLTYLIPSSVYPPLFFANTNRNSEAWSRQLPKDSTLREQVCYGNTHLRTVMRNITVTGDLKTTVWPHPLYCVQWLFFKIFFYVSSGQGFIAEHLPYFPSHDTCKINTF